MFLSFTGSALALLQSWHESFSSAWTTSIRSGWRIPTHCWSRALHCSTCGRPGRARGQKVSQTVPFHPRYLMLFVPGTPVLSSFGLRVIHASAVESLYMALKSIDRMDIVNMLEGQPPQPARQGSRDPSRSRHEREHLSPGMTNGEFRVPYCTVAARVRLPVLPRPWETSPKYTQMSLWGRGEVWASSFWLTHKLSIHMQTDSGHSYWTPAI